ncbi:MAG: YkvA family protein [Chloroflexota bacterium]
MWAIWRLWYLWRRIGGWRGILADGLLAWSLFRDRRVPIFPKLIFPLVLLYFVSPLNLPFQWIPILGQVDDVGISMLALAAFLRACPSDLVAEHATRLRQDLLRTDRFGALGRLARPALDRAFERWTTRR